MFVWTIVGITYLVLGVGDQVAASSELPSNVSEVSCSVRFGSFPDEISKAEQVRRVRLISGSSEIKELDLLEPSFERGLWVVRAEQPDADPIYTEYKLQTITEFRKHPIQRGLTGLSWDSAAQQKEEYVIEVPPGLYRVAMSYALPAAPGPGGSDRRKETRVCLALSPTFKVVSSLYFLVFEQDRQEPLVRE